MHDKSHYNDPQSYWLNFGAQHITLFNVTLSVDMLNVVRLSVVILSVIMLTAFLLSTHSYVL